MEKVEAKQANNTFVEKHITAETIKHTQDEKNAILHFNKDKRFTITE